MQLEKELEKTRKASLRYIILTVLIVISVIFIYSRLTNVDLSILFNLKLAHFLLILFLLTLLPPLNSLKMIYIAEKIGVRDRVGGIIARIASQFAADTTPSTIAAHVVKSYWVKKNNMSWGEGLGVSLTDSFFDALLWNLSAATIALVELSNGNLIFVPIVLVSLYSLFGYVTIFVFAINKRLRNATVRFVNFMRLPLTEEGLEKLSKVFLSTIKNPKKLMVVLFLAFVSLLYQSLIVVVVALSLGMEMSIIEGVIFFTIGQTMKSLPIPAGAGMLEFGISLVAEPELVLAWRVLTFTYLIIYYAIFFQIFIMRYIGKKEEGK